jgi:hypothetical protein
VRGPLVLPELCHYLPPDTPHRDRIATSPYKPVSHSTAAVNDLETAVPVQLRNAIGNRMRPWLRQAPRRLDTPSQDETTGNAFLHGARQVRVNVREVIGTPTYV